MFYSCLLIFGLLFRLILWLWIGELVMILVGSKCIGRLFVISGRRLVGCSVSIRVEIRILDGLKKLWIWLIMFVVLL